LVTVVAAQAFSIAILAQVALDTLVGAINIVVAICGERLRMEPGAGRAKKFSAVSNTIGRKYFSKEPNKK